jgi:hypothetical protein
MANKNSKVRNKSVSTLAKERKQHGSEIVISTNRKRNMQMKVYTNEDGFGNKQSITAHEAMSKGDPVRFPNHHYLEYRHPSTNKSR